MSNLSAAGMMLHGTPVHDTTTDSMNMRKLCSKKKSLPRCSYMTPTAGTSCSQLLLLHTENQICQPVDLGRQLRNFHFDITRLYHIHVVLLAHARCVA